MTYNPLLSKDILRTELERKTDCFVNEIYKRVENIYRNAVFKTLNTFY